MEEDKIIVSQFEYAIMQAANHPGISSYRPITNDEIDKKRINKIEEFYSKIKKKS